MKRRIFVVLLLVIIIVSSGISSAAGMNIESLDKVVLIFELKDGTIKEVSQTNKHNGKFEKAVINLLDYYYNIYNVSKLLSLNDTPIEQTQYSQYAGKIDDNKKGLGYSNSPDIVQRAINNENMNLVLTEINPNTTTLKVDGEQVRCSGNVYISGDQTYLPLRSVLEALRYDVIADFNAYYQMIIATTKRSGKEEIRIEVRLGSQMVYISTVGIVELSAPLELKDDGTYIAVSDAIGLTGAEIRVNGNDITIFTEVNNEKAD